MKSLVLLAAGRDISPAARRPQRCPLHDDHERGPEQGLLRIDDLRRPLDRRRPDVVGREHAGERRGASVVDPRETTLRDGITDTFAVGNHLDPQGHKYPLYIAWEDYSAGVVNTLLIASYDGGSTWTAPVQVNDNTSPVDEFQPNLTVADNGTVSVAFYDRRLACPAADSPEAAGAGIALDQAAQNPDYTGPVPPYGATNYCVNAALQFYTARLAPFGHNIRLTQHSWDPQLNSPHPGSPAGDETFIGDYFGNVTSGSRDITTSVSTYNDGTNPANQQQQVIATVAVP